MKETKDNRGITLIALVITIIVLLILAGVAINLGINGGLFGQAGDAANKWKKAEKNEKDKLGEYIQDIRYWAYNESPLVTTITTTNHGTIEAQDAKGNKVVVPGGFKIASSAYSTDEEVTVQTGIVIEDDNGNQFVWVPVSNINGDNNKDGDADGTEDYLITLDDNSTVEITLGRYTFESSSSSSPGASTIVQVGENYSNAVARETYYQELSTSEGNTAAKNLQAFVESVRDNKGYYFARYEASYGSGSAFGEGNDDTYYKPLSKPSTAKSTSSMNYNEGTLWNCITQPNAALVCRQMYFGDSYVESDLVNTYAWDTAVVYIQAMGNENYANANRGSNTTLLNTGSTGDSKCKIFDMAGNLIEWSTEHSTYSSGRASNKTYYPCVVNGGYYYSAGTGYTPSYRYFEKITRNDFYDGFRPLLYIK